MSTVGDTHKALRSVLMLQDDVSDLKEAAKAQSDRLTRLAEAHGSLRDRVSRLEGIIEGAAMASGRSPQPRIEG